MSYSDKIGNRQVVNLNADLSQAASVNQITNLNLRFVPDYAIVRQITYNNSSAAAASRICAQIYFDLALDQIIGSFALQNANTSTPNTEMFIRQGFQSGATTMQIQLIPTSGTGNGPLITPSAEYGQLSVIIEFFRAPR